MNTKPKKNIKSQDYVKEWRDEIHLKKNKTQHNHTSGLNYLLKFIPLVSVLNLLMKFVSLSFL